MGNCFLRKERIEGLSDGVIAVAITLMFLGFEESYQEIREARSSQAIWAYLVSEWPRVSSYCLSFLFIGGYWIKHHLIFHYVQRADRVFLGLNLLFLMCIAFIPVSTDWLVESAQHEFNAILVVYGLSYTINSLTLLGIWSWATANRRLVFRTIDEETIRSIRGQIMGGLLATLLGIAVSFVSIQAGLTVLVFAALSILWPRSADGDWIRCQKLPESSSDEPASTVQTSAKSYFPGVATEAVLIE